MKKVCVAALFIVAGCVVGCVAGCATGGPSRPLTQFPGPAALAAIEQQPAVLPKIEVAAVPVEGWTVEATAAAQSPLQVWTPAGAWDQAFLTSFTADRQKARVTRAMSCVAEQLGRWRLQRKGAWPEQWQQFVAAACGAATQGIGSSWQTAEVPASVSDEQALAHYRSTVWAALLKNIPEAAAEVGFWFGRAHGRLILIETHARPLVELKALNLIPDAAGNVTFEGRFLGGEVAHFEANINQGPFGVAPCQLDPAVSRPLFRASCPVASGDDLAWFQLSYVPPKSVLASSALLAMARRDPGKPLTFAAPAVSGGSTDGASFRAAVLQKLNLVRAQAGLKEVRLAAVQSDSADRIAGQYFVASADQRLEQMNTIALGLMAGWQVAGTIRTGTFFSNLLATGADAGQWLEWAMIVPIGRRAILAPEIDEIALGTALFHGPERVGAMIAGYSLQKGNDHSADVNALYQKIIAARRRAGLSAPVRLGGLDAVIAGELARVQAGQQNPGEALDGALQVAVNRFHSDMRGLVIEATSVDYLDVPAELLSQARLYLEIGVAHHKPPGAAWSQLVIVLVFASATGVAI